MTRDECAIRCVTNRHTVYRKDFVVCHRWIIQPERQDEFRTNQVRQQCNLGNFLSDARILQLNKRRIGGPTAAAVGSFCSAFPALKIPGNLYDVGTAGLAVYLIKLRRGTF